MKFFCIILFIHFNYTSSQLLNNESLLVFHETFGDLFSVKFEKTLTQSNRSDAISLVKTKSYRIGEIDYNLRANIIVWRDRMALMRIRSIRGNKII
jgi:hypothetical protein